MDLLMYVIKWTWNIFQSIAIPITYQGITYNITFFGMLIFTTIVSTAVWLLFKFFE